MTSHYRFRNRRGLGLREGRRDPLMDAKRHLEVESEYGQPQIFRLRSLRRRAFKMTGDFFEADFGDLPFALDHDYGGGMRTVLARQEGTELQAMGWRRLSRQTSMAVRKLWPQLTTMLWAGMAGLLAVKRVTI